MVARRALQGGASQDRFLESTHRARRGERGVEWMGGPLWNPVWGTGMPAQACNHLQLRLE